MEILSYLGGDDTWVKLEEKDDQSSQSWQKGKRSKTHKETGLWWTNDHFINCRKGEIGCRYS